jgi:chromosome segregation ATPase
MDKRPLGNKHMTLNPYGLYANWSETYDPHESAVDRSLAKKKTTRHAVEQVLQNSNDAKAELTQELESIKASLTATHDKLTSKSAALDVVMIREQQAKLQMKTAEEKPEAAEKKLKTQDQSLDSARQTFSK